MQSVIHKIGSGLFALIDSQRKVSYRRLVVFVASVILLATGAIGEDTWLWVALTYVASEGAQAIASRLATAHRAPIEAPPADGSRAPITRAARPNGYEGV